MIGADDIRFLALALANAYISLSSAKGLTNSMIETMVMRLPVLAAIYHLIQS
jgi:hypothetical protein